MTQICQSIQFPVLHEGLPPHSRLLFWYVVSLATPSSNFYTWKTSPSVISTPRQGLPLHSCSHNPSTVQGRQVLQAGAGTGAGIGALLECESQQNKCREASTKECRLASLLMLRPTFREKGRVFQEVRYVKTKRPKPTPFPLPRVTYF